jgi:hypothetical protein
MHPGPAKPGHARQRHKATRHIKNASTSFMEIAKMNAVENARQNSLK